MIVSLCETLLKLDTDPNVRVIMLTGAGKSFCAGGDVKAMKSKSGMFAGESDELRTLYRQGIQNIPRTIEHIQTPLIALVNGAAIGAGLDLACMCDIRIASERAKFAESFTTIGLVPGDGGCFFLQRVIGYAKAMELSLLGELIDSAKACEIGLVNRVCLADDLLKVGTEYAAKISANSYEATRLTKLGIRQAYRSSLSEHLDTISAFQGISQRTKEHFDLLEKKFNI
jgi:enoyl-CoA hydratase/carnithine racemase